MRKYEKTAVFFCKGLDEAWGCYLERVVITIRAVYLLVINIVKYSTVTCRQRDVMPRSHVDQTERLWLVERKDGSSRYLGEPQRLEVSLRQVLKGQGEPRRSEAPLE